ncbi:MAG: hypothetical protein SFV21_15870 [Rhodospirillaceae bacterium]|nr:hypothetical protein [Rhodospirillaceae bacterium]
MTRRFFAASAGLAAVVLTVSAEAQTAAQCPPLNEQVAITFTIADPHPIYSNALTANGIMDLEQKRTGVVNLGRRGRTMGITSYTPRFQLSANSKSRPSGAGYCVYLTEVIAEYGFNTHEVFIAKEFPLDSCEYGVVLDHENQHVAINRTSLNEFAPKVKAELEQAVAAIGPIYSPTPTIGGNDVLQRVAQRIAPVMREAQQVRSKRNAGIDTAGNYHDTSKKCGDWDQGNIFLDGRPRPPTTPAMDPFGLNKPPPPIKLPPRKEK